MAYTKTEWKTGDPITQERMNHIEDGIAAAQNTADGALRPDDDVEYEDHPRAVRAAGHEE